MGWVDRQGNPVPGDEGQDSLLEWMYGTKAGNVLVSILIRPWVSRLAGWLMDSRLSALAVKPFIQKNRICMDDFQEGPYPSFNAFFTRRLRDGARPVDEMPGHLIAPCDSKLSVYPIGENSRFRIKGVEYTLRGLLKDNDLVRRFEGGTLLLFRLTVGDYHRYGYIDSGRVSGNTHIPGVYHTVNPAAVGRVAVYRENTREYSLLESEAFGTVLQMEVGATMVGRIVNAPGRCAVRRGQEKGRFEFGGSTVIVCLQKGAAVLDGDLIENTARELETVVHFGERIGRASGFQE